MARNLASAAEWRARPVATPEPVQTLEKPVSSLPFPLDLIQRRGSSPRPLLVDASAPPARIELSSRVLANWWAKDLGLLEGEFSLGPGDTVVFVAAPTWRTIPLAVAALTLGTHVTEGEDRLPDADLVVTDRLTPSVLEAPEVLAVTTQALAVDFGEKLPAGVVDHAAEVRGYPDQPFIDASLAASLGWDTGTAGGGLEVLADAVRSAEGDAVTAVPCQRGVLTAVVHLLACGDEGHLVLHAGEMADARLVAQEGITAQA